MDHYYIHPVNFIIIFKKTKKLLHMNTPCEGEQKRKEISLCVHLGNHKNKFMYMKINTRWDTVGLVIPVENNTRINCVSHKSTCALPYMVLTFNSRKASIH